ncbi:MAG: tRNA (adenosine(37)-N6)-threonylcarbamoyltransferase complex ATPase subunit type 1 TsaE [Planctomycetota bacterium]
MIEITSESPEETRELARWIGRLLQPGDVIALDGCLGAGKTCFTQGLAAGLEVDSEEGLSSPSYTLMNEYPGRLTLYHFDAYFFEKGESLLDAGADDYFFGEGVCVVEWAEKVRDVLPEGHLSIRIEPIGATRRHLRLEGPSAWLERLRPKSARELGD